MNQSATAEIRPVALSVEAAAKMLSVGRNTIFDLMNAGELKRIKIGKRTLIRVSDIEDFMERRAAA